MLKVKSIIIFGLMTLSMFGSGLIIYSQEETPRITILTNPTSEVLVGNNLSIEIVIECPTQKCNFINVEIEFDPHFLQIDSEQIISGDYFGTNEEGQRALSLIKSSDTDPDIKVIQLGISNSSEDFIPDAQGVLFSFNAVASQPGIANLTFTNRIIMLTNSGESILPELVNSQIEIVIPSATPTLTFTPTPTPDIRVIAIQSVKIYTVPSIDDARILMEFPINTEFFVIGRIPATDNSWLYLRLPNGETGWLKIDLNVNVNVGDPAQIPFVTPTWTPKPSPTDTPTATWTASFTPTPVYEIVAPLDNINVRVQPNTAADIVARIQKNERFRVIETIESGDGFTWYKVATTAGEGYIREDVIEIDQVLADGTIIVMSTPEAGSSCRVTWSYNQALTIVTPTGVVDVFLRQSPGSRNYSKVQNQQAVFVTGGPSAYAGQCWWKVRTNGLVPTLEGWVESGSLK